MVGGVIGPATSIGLIVTRSPAEQAVPPEESVTL